ncbi:MAG: hypothetical protein J6S63_12680 [Atopobiaceae bacterium]|nr:hypothetical protein [Atopobiaceae bacterium]
MSKKAKKKNPFKGFMPMVPPMMAPMPFMFPMAGAMPWGMDEEADKGAKALAKDFDSNMRSFWEKTIDMQKSSIDASRDQYNQFFSYMMDMQDNFAESLPDEAFSFMGLPPFPISPKAFMGYLKDFEEIANAHFVEQANACTDFFIQGQQKACDIAGEVSENVKKQAEETEAKAEEAPAENQDQNQDQNGENQG